MFLANTSRGHQQSPALSGELGTCPLCGRTVLAKCGEIVQWHWAHESAIDCDPWSEPESPWHYTWKNRFPRECQEIIVGQHRADVISERGWILEFQHCPLSVAEIREREQFYGTKLIWIADGKDCGKNFHFRKTQKHGPELTNRVPVTFRWKWPRKTWATARRPVFVDLDGELLLRIRWMSLSTPCGGWGILTPVSAFLGWALAGTKPFSPWRNSSSNWLAEHVFDQQRRADSYGVDYYRAFADYEYEGVADYEDDEDEGESACAI